MSLKTAWVRGGENLTTEDTVSWRSVRQLRPCYPRGTWWSCRGREQYSSLSPRRSTVPAQWRNDGPPACLSPCCRAAHSRPDSRDHRPGPQHSQPQHHLTVHHHDCYMYVCPMFYHSLPLLTIANWKQISQLNLQSWLDIFLVWHWDIVLSSLSQM